ncbi:MAG TPA: FHA domain-containing protein [Gemmatimonadaceae bacterium]
MPVFQLNDQQYPLRAGTTRIGSGADADVVLPVDPAREPSAGLQAVIDQGRDGGLTIRRAGPAAQVRVNGVLLGAEPTPLMHGDKVEIAGVELHFADDTKAGATQFVSASEIAALAGARRTGTARPTAASGGRLVSLVDGKEYTVPTMGLLIGRDASCDVVVAQQEVSRRHAEIAPGDAGYVIRDTSANGVFVNGERIQEPHRLARSDVVRVGSEEFRFYADVLHAPAGAAPQPSAAERPPAAAHAVADAGPAADAPSKAVADSIPTPLATPAFEDPRPVLATLEVMNPGPMKGTRFSLRSPLSHVGRGAHNDVRLVDDSVSETHAKLQRRDDGWYVVDMDSTNGTYLAGNRVTGERRISGASDVRFGGLKLRFEPAEASARVEAEVKGTRAIASVDRKKAPPAAKSPAPGAPPVREDVPKGGISAWVWLVVLLILGVAAYLVLQGRA